MKKPVIPVAIGVVLLVVISGFLIVKGRPSSSPAAPSPTPVPAPVNIIDLKDRPYVTLEPLVTRNDLNFTIHNLPKPATTVEVTLEYDRNKGVLDAVLKQFALSAMPFSDTIFLGSKSAGGHTTYHEDVTGGTLTLRFMGKEPYSLKVPWRYADTQKEYPEISTTDGFFQAIFSQPIKQLKILVMQSPGAPEGLKGEIISGPYLIRTVGPLPQLTVNLTLRLSAESATATLWGYDGSAWSKLPATVNGKTLTSSAPLLPVYVVTQ